MRRWTKTIIVVSEFYGLPLLHCAAIDTRLQIVAHSKCIWSYRRESGREPDRCDPGSPESIIINRGNTVGKHYYAWQVFTVIKRFGFYSLHTIRNIYGAQLGTAVKDAEAKSKSLRFLYVKMLSLITNTGKKTSILILRIAVISENNQIFIYYFWKHEDNRNRYKFINTLWV